MKLFSRFSMRSKAVLGTALAVVAAAAVALPGVTHADLGADRQTKAYVEGMAGFDHVQFNSFTGVPNIGDERQFFTGMIDGANTPFYTSLNGVQSGDTMLVRVYVHNNASTTLNESGVGVAKNTRVRVVMPTDLATTQTAQAFVSADNAQPQVVQDNFTVTSATPVGLAYVPGSATIKTNYQDVAVSDNIVRDGVLIGDKDLSGNMPGCFDHVALVTFKVKVTAPSYSLEKKVRMNGTTDYSEQVTAKAGDKVNFVLGFHNTGTTQLNDVVVGDRMPVGLTYVPNSTEWKAGYTNNQWAKVTNDGWMKGGLSLGNYNAGAAVYVRFTATVDDASKLECGLNRLTNMGFAHSGTQGTIQDSAEVDVTRECAATATPVYSCDLFELTKDEATKTVTVKTFNQTAKDGATFKSVDINWGENGTTPLNTNSPVGKTHQFTGNGPFTITATAHFAVPGNDNVTATSTNCAKTVSFTSPVAAVTTTPEAPTELVNTGAGNVFALFAAVTVLAAAMHRVFVRRMAR